MVSGSTSSGVLVVMRGLCISSHIVFGGAGVLTPSPDLGGKVWGGETKGSAKTAKGTEII